LYKALKGKMTSNKQDWVSEDARTIAGGYPPVRNTQRNRCSSGRGFREACSRTRERWEKNLLRRLPENQKKEPVAKFRRCDERGKAAGEGHWTLPKGIPVRSYCNEKKKP